MLAPPRSVRVLWSTIEAAGPWRWRRREGSDRRERGHGHQDHRALNRLIEGDARFTRADPERRGQFPDTGSSVPPTGSPAGVLGCSDPRVPADTIFDLAQAVASSSGRARTSWTTAPWAAGFTASYLDVPLIVVMGHDDCRAMRAAVAQTAGPGSIGTILDAIEPSVLRARNRGVHPEELVAKATEEHVRATVAELSTSRVLHPLVDRGDLQIRGAVYHLADGVVEWLAL